MHFSTAREIGFLIREARNREGLTQAELASRNNTKQAWISEIENGKSTVELGTVLQVMKDLKIVLEATLPPSPEEIVTPDDTPDVDEDEDYRPPYTI